MQNAVGQYLLKCCCFSHQCVLYIVLVLVLLLGSSLVLLGASVICSFSTISTEFWDFIRLVLYNVVIASSSTIIVLVLYTLIYNCK